MADLEKRTPKEICHSFNLTTNQLVKVLEQKSRTELELANLERVRKRISMAKQVGGDNILIEEAVDFFLDFSEPILNREENFFMTLDVKSKYHHKIKKEDEFVYSLIDSVREHYKKMKQAERDDVYNKVLTLYTDCLGYRLKVPKKAN